MLAQQHPCVPAHLHLRLCLPAATAEPRLGPQVQAFPRLDGDPPCHCGSDRWVGGGCCCCTGCCPVHTGEEHLGAVQALEGTEGMQGTGWPFMLPANTRITQH